MNKLHLKLAAGVITLAHCLSLGYASNSDEGDHQKKVAQHKTSLDDQSSSSDIERTQIEVLDTFSMTQGKQQTSNELIRRGNNALFRKEFDQAITYYSKALTISDMLDDVRFNIELSLSHAYLGLNQYENAIEKLEHILFFKSLLSNNMLLQVRANLRNLYSFPSTVESIELQESVLTKAHNIPIDVWRQITSYLDCKTAKLHHVNRYFFNVVTDYPITGIKDVGFDNHLSLSHPLQSQIQGVAVNFSKQRINCVPSYVWYSFVDKIINLSRDYWPNIKYTRVHTVDLSNNYIGLRGARELGQSLKGTQVHTVNLFDNEIGDEGAREFAQSLKDTKIHTVSLYHNKIGPKGAREFGQSLKDTQVHTVSLGGNELGSKGAREFGQSLKGTQVHTVKLDNTIINATGLSDRGQPLTREFGQSLKDTQVHTIDLSNNCIGNAAAHELGESLIGTQVHTVKLSSNFIRDEGARALGKSLKDTQVHTVNLSGNLTDDISGFESNLNGIKINVIL